MSHPDLPSIIQTLKENEASITSPPADRGMGTATEETLGKYLLLGGFMNKCKG